MMERIMLPTLMALVGLVGVLMLIASCREAAQWEAFKIERNCYVVGRTSTQVVPGMGTGSNGQMTMVLTTIPGQTGWACDDGVTYWR